MSNYSSIDRSYRPYLNMQCTAHEHTQSFFLPLCLVQLGRLSLFQLQNLRQSGRSKVVLK